MKKLLLILALLLTLPRAGADPLDLITDPAQRAFADTLVAEYDKFIISHAERSDLPIEEIYGLYFNNIAPIQLNGAASLKNLYTPEIFTQWAIDGYISTKLPPITTTMRDICTAIGDQNADSELADYFYQIASTLEAAGDFAPSVVARIIKESKPLRWTYAERYIVAANFLTKSMPLEMLNQMPVPKPE